METDRITLTSSASSARIDIFNLEPPHPGQPVEHFWVRLKDWHLQAVARVYAGAAPDLVAYFEDIAAHWTGWSGVRTWESLEHEFRLECASDHLGHITFIAFLEADPDQVTWRVRLRVETEAGLLSPLAGQAKSFFAGRRFAGYC